MTQILTHSIEETEYAGFEFAKSLKNGGAVIAMRGGLGMGKTAFVRGMAKYISPEAYVHSPTFAIVNDYGGTPHFYHFDMYRIETYEDLYSTGFFDYLDTESILAVEWSENIENALPENSIVIEFTRGTEENERIIKITEGDDSAL